MPPSAAVVSATATALVVVGLLFWQVHKQNSEALSKARYEAAAKLAAKNAADEEAAAQLAAAEVRSLLESLCVSCVIKTSIWKLSKPFTVITHGFKLKSCNSVLSSLVAFSPRRRRQLPKSRRKLPLRLP
jgi:hypothetical protein